MLQRIQQSPTSHFWQNNTRHYTECFQQNNVVECLIVLYIKSTHAQERNTFFFSNWEKLYQNFLSTHLFFSQVQEKNLDHLPHIFTLEIMFNVRACVRRNPYASRQITFFLSSLGDGNRIPDPSNEGKTKIDDKQP